MTFDLRRTLQQSVRTNLSATLARESRRQEWIGGIAVRFDVDTFQRVADDVANNAAQGLIDVVDMAREYCREHHEQLEDGCSYEHCPFYSE